MHDLISRKAAIDALEKEKPTPFVNKDGSIDPFCAGQQNQWYRDGIAIMNLPSAEPRKGKWIATHERTLFSHPDSITYVCSECGYKIYTVYGMPSTTNFCPNCGADMRGEEDA